MVSAVPIVGGVASEGTLSVGLRMWIVISVDSKVDFLENE